jgi:hypothetical protein
MTMSDLELTGLIGLAPVRIGRSPAPYVPTNLAHVHLCKHCAIL